MSFQSMWFHTELPREIVDILDKELSGNDGFNDTLLPSQVGGDESGQVHEKVRNSKNSWIPTSHWISGFIWNYVQLANKFNFLYDLTGVDGESLQYTVYNEGEYYNWHIDAGISSYYKPMSETNRVDPAIVVNDYINQNIESIRKLSFSLQLSDSDEYEGGQFQLMDENGKSYFAPKKKGVLIVFDSRAPHRVRKVTKGVRKSIVGWSVGPRWR